VSTELHADGINRGVRRSWRERSQVSFRQFEISVVALFVVVFSLSVFLLGWNISGGGVYTDKTPSMCPSACVGALFIDRPLHGSVHQGELITFRPFNNAVVYTHRVIKVEANGDFKTKGDASLKADPWLVTPQEIVGKVDFSIWGAGYVVLALPWLLTGTVLLVALRRIVPDAYRRSMNRLVIVGLVVVLIFLYHPLLNAQIVESVQKLTSHRANDRVANTGLLPVRVEASQTHHSIVLSRGDLGSFAVKTNAKGVSRLSAVAALDWWGWVIAAFVIGSPLFSYFLYTRRHFWRRAKDDVHRGSHHQVYCVGRFDGKGSSSTIEEMI